jgi:hypothetical protein
MKQKEKKELSVKVQILENGKVSDIKKGKGLFGAIITDEKFEVALGGEIRGYDLIVALYTLQHYLRKHIENLELMEQFTNQKGEKDESRRQS